MHSHSYLITFLCSLFLHILLILNWSHAGAKADLGQRINLTLTQSIATPPVHQPMTPEPKENLTEPEPEPEPEPERFIGTANDKSVEEITQVTTAPVKPKPSPPEKTVEELIEEVQIDGTQSMPEWLATARDDQVSLSAGISSPSPSPDQDLDGISQAKGHTGSGQGLYSSEFKPAKFINLSQPSFPKSSRRKGHEGAVLLEVHIDSGGTLTTVNILKSSGYVNFDNAGLAAFKDVKAEPATDNGIAVASKKKIRFRFKLRE